MKQPALRFKRSNDGEFPDWECKKIKDIASKMKAGGTPKANVRSYYDGDIPFLGISDISKSGKYVSDTIKCISPEGLQSSSAWIVPAGTLILSMYASYGKPCISKVDLATSQALIAIELKGDYSVEFIYQVFSKFLNSGFWNKYVKTGAQPNLSKSVIESTDIYSPCLEEQQKIASFFSTLDQKIELNERKLEALEKLKKGVMQKIFDHEFSFKNKEGKEFPEWEKTYLKDILLFQNGINTGKENFGTGIKLISVNEVLSPFPIKYDDISSSVMVDDNVGKKFSVTYGDVLFQRSSETREDAGTSNVYIDNTREAVFGGFVIRGKRIGDYNPIFLHELLRSPKVRQQIIKYAQGAQHINIGQESLEKIEIKLPCREEQEKIAELAIALYKKIELLTNKVEELKNLKKGFMQQMFV